MMLDHFGETETAQHLLNAIEGVIEDGIKTKDIGGNATTEQVTDAICDRLKA
jgi:tartrate dehydrogenase/decarboxylase/D-malate dehydrogenase